MAKSNIANVVAVVPVSDHGRATAWYARLFGREADIAPIDGVAEWQLAENGWVQVAQDPDHAGGTTVIVGVNDIQEQCDTCAAAGVPLGEVVEYPGVVRMAEATDAEGNTVAFVQDISAQG